MSHIRYSIAQVFLNLSLSPPHQGPPLPHGLRVYWPRAIRDRIWGSRLGDVSVDYDTWIIDTHHKIAGIPRR